MGTSQWSTDFRPHGGYVDEVRFMIFDESESDLALTALWNGEIDAYDTQVPTDYIGGCWRTPDVELAFSPSKRYRAYTLNCELFPANITAFRRAMAFGFDKHRANIEIIGGIGQPQDSHIPVSALEWQVESEMPEYFYEPDYTFGNKSLENAGFIDLDYDGWREYDKNRNGVWDVDIDLDDDKYADGGVLVMVVYPGHAPHIRVCQIMQDGLARMGIRSEIFDWDCLCSIFNCLWTDICCGLSWTEGVNVLNTPKILYDHFRTGVKYNSDPYNYYHFSNATIDHILDQMMNSTSLEDVKHYAAEAAKLLAFEQPQIVLYSDTIVNAYRTDKFDGFIEFSGLGTTSGINPYVVTKVHLNASEGELYGGTFKYGLSGDLNTRNCYLEKTGYENTVFQYIYEKLWNLDPTTWDPIPGLAYDWEIKTTTASGDILDGQKFTFYLYQNATWHDSQPVTSKDVEHSFNLAQQSPYAPQELFDIYHVVTPDDHTIEFFVNETGYCEWGAATSFPYIVPWHIWQDVTNVTAFNPTDVQMIGSGPYQWNEHVPGDYISLLRYDGWRWDIREVPTTTPITSEKPVIPTTSQVSSSRSTSTAGFTTFLLLLTFLGFILIKRFRTNWEN